MNENEEGVLAVEDVHAFIVDLAVRAKDGGTPAAPGSAVCSVWGRAGKDLAIDLLSELERKGE